MPAGLAASSIYATISDEALFRAGLSAVPQGTCTDEQIRALLTPGGVQLWPVVPGVFDFRVNPAAASCLVYGFQVVVTPSPSQSVRYAKL